MIIYTDASTRKGISGIAFVVTNNKDEEKYKTGKAIDEGDNNIAELKAVLFALDFIEEVNKVNKIRHVTVYTDSRYVISSLNGERRRKKKSFENREKEKAILQCIRAHSAWSHTIIDLMWTKGHYRNESPVSFFNKRADKMSKVVRHNEEKRRKAERARYISQRMQVVIKFRESQGRR